MSVKHKFKFCTHSWMLERCKTTVSPRQRCLHFRPMDVNFLGKRVSTEKSFGKLSSTYWNLLVKQWVLSYCWGWHCRNDDNFLQSFHVTQHLSHLKLGNVIYWETYVRMKNKRFPWFFRIICCHKYFGVKEQLANLPFKFFTLLNIQLN